MHLHFSIDKTYSRFFNNYNCQLWPILSADNQNQAGFSQLWVEGKRTVAGLSLSGGGEMGADMEKVFKIAQMKISNLLLWWWLWL